ncbi:MAG: hypothetical protein ABI990_07615 [Actinomycetota bacterium]
MTTQTRRITEQPLNLVLRPDSPAEAAYKSAVLAPGFEPAPGLALEYLGGRTLSNLAYRLVYLGRWQASERQDLDRALAAAMRDPGLNEILQQYFPSATVTVTVNGSSVHRGTVPARVDKQFVEALVSHIAEPNDSTAVICVLLPRGAVLVERDGVTSETGLGGYHGSLHKRGTTLYYAVAVYSEGANGIVAFDAPWKNVCGTLYHELQEVRTDPDVEDAIRAGRAPAATHMLGWYSPNGGEIGDIPIRETHGDIHLAMKEVPLGAGGTAPVQLMWSNRVGGPEAPPTS